MTATATGICFVNALIDGGGTTSLRVVGERIASLGGGPAAADRVVDLRGDRLLPGLVNAHDHLQLNVYPPLRYRARHANVGEWIRDVEARRATDPAIATARAVPRTTRCHHGALKNLLAGVTTVAHHDPLDASMREPDFPTHVVERFGWSHSLPLDGADACVASYRRTPRAQPWIVHAAEGVDDESRREFDTLDALGCIGPNTLLVHGVALDVERRERIVATGAALVWCPTSNLNLFGATAVVDVLARRGRVALGTDSRLTGARDLLEELRTARAVATLDATTLTAMVTTVAARLLGLEDRGRLATGCIADLVVLPRELDCGTAQRSDLRLVMRGGAFALGDADCASALLPAERRTPVELDGRARIIAAPLAALLARHDVREPGFTAGARRWRVA